VMAGLPANCYTLLYFFYFFYFTSLLYDAAQLDSSEAMRRMQAPLISWYLRDSDNTEASSPVTIVVSNQSGDGDAPLAARVVCTWNSDNRRQFSQLRATAQTRRTGPATCAVAASMQHCLRQTTMITRRRRPAIVSSYSCSCRFLLQQLLWRHVT